MNGSRYRGVLALLVVVVGLAWPMQPDARRAADTIPARLSDDDFWKLSETLSEPGGSFRTDNLLSNELYYPAVIPDLIKRVPASGVYLGVGPEQNFNYIVAIRPKMVFITDVRRGNLLEQLMYKALFEVSADRAEFVSRLFSKPRPAGLTEKSTVSEIMRAYWDVPTSPEPVYKKNLQDLEDHLVRTHKFPLTKDDLEGPQGFEYIYNAFYWYGPSITYNSSGSNGFGRGGNMASYASLMMSTDAAGLERSYLATEEAFRFMKDLESRNMIVPVMGNFGGPKALRAIGQYVRERGATVSAFYLSNVEQYLRQDNILGVFCSNVASMPLTERSTFIRSQTGGGGGMFTNYLGEMQSETAGCQSPVGAAGSGR